MKKRYEKFTVVVTFLCVALLIASSLMVNDYENLITIKDDRISDLEKDVKNLKSDISNLENEMKDR